MSDLEDSEDGEHIPDTVEREMDDDGDEVDENEENDLLMSDETSDDDCENNEDKCENATTSRLTLFCFVCISQGKQISWFSSTRLGHTLCLLLT